MERCKACKGTQSIKSWVQIPEPAKTVVVALRKSTCVMIRRLWVRFLLDDGLFSYFFSFPASTPKKCLKIVPSRRGISINDAKIYHLNAYQAVVALPELSMLKKLILSFA